MSDYRAAALTVLTMTGCFHEPIPGPGQKRVLVRVESQPAHALSVKAQFLSAAEKVKPCDFVPCNRCLPNGALLVAVIEDKSRYERHVVIPDKPARAIIRRNHPAAFHLGYSLVLGAVGLLGGGGGAQKAKETVIRSSWADPHWQDKLALLQGLEIGLMAVASAMVVTGTTLLFTSLRRDRIEVKPWQDPPREVVERCSADSAAAQEHDAAPPLVPPEDSSLKAELLVVRGMPGAAPFLIEQTEVTVEKYQRCVQARRCTEPERGETCTWGVRGHARFPINCVDQAQAAAYCTSLQRRLPTDEEWQYLLATYGTSAGNLHKLERPQEGGLQAAGAFGAVNGVHDLIGNVWEWSASSRGMSWGGSFDTMFPAQGGPSALKNAVSVTAHLPTLGFRCAADLP